MAGDVAECAWFTVLDAARIEDVGWPLIDELAGDALAFDHAQAAFEQVGGRQATGTLFGCRVERCRGGGRTCRHAVLIPCSRASATRSEEHTSELQSLMRISYAVFCLKKKNTTK